MTPRAERRPRARGFTLLEVIAAVAVLALVYTSLARAAMQGLANQGDASRRLRASLLADQALAQIEALLAAGTAPPLGQSEAPSPDEDFAITVEVRAFEDFALALAATEAEPGAAPRRAPERDEGSREETTRALLAAPPGGAPPLLEIAVRVRWIEGVHEQEVSRTTFAADPAVVDPLLQAIAEQSDADAGDQEGEAAAEPGMQPGAGGPAGVPEGFRPAGVPEESFQ